MNIVTKSDLGTYGTRARGCDYGYTADGDKIAKIRTQVPLDHYLNRGYISLEQHQAGNELHRRWYLGAERGNLSKMRFDSEAKGAPNYERCVAMEELYNSALKAIVKVDNRVICYKVCCFGEWASYISAKWGKNRRISMLQEGLNDLDKHFTSGN